jgi:hypothetical protein
MDEQIETSSSTFARSGEVGGVSGGEVGGGERVVVDGECGREDALAVRRDAVEAGSANLGNEPLTAEFGDQPGRSGAPSSALVVVGGWPGMEAVDEVVVAEPHDRVASGEHGSEEGEVGWLERVEAGAVTSVTGPGSAQGVERGDALTVWLGGGEGFEVAPVRSDAHLEVPPHVADAVVHLAPPPLAPALSVGLDSQRPELARIVDRGLHPQGRGLVVDLDPVAGETVLDPPALGRSNIDSEPTTCSR